MGVKATVQALKERQLSCKEVTEHYLKRSEKLNPNLNAIVCANEDVLVQAEALDQKKDKDGILFGAPIAIKDLFCTKGIKSTACSNILNNFVPPYTATCVSRLQNEGALILSKTNMDEFAMGSSNEVSLFGACKNPWDQTRVPGGSSGGSAAAVSAGLAPAALGSDTGGSIRQPASFCGVVGVKPTYGSVSRYGMIAFASSLDQAGPMANSVEDCALLLEAMIAKDSKDATNAPRKVGPLINLQIPSIKGRRLGLPKQYFEGELSEGVHSAIDKIIDLLKKEGAELVEIDLPHTSFAVPVYYLVATSEASSNLSRYDGIRYGLRVEKDDEGLPVKDLHEFYSITRSKGFGEEVQRRILLGTFSLSSGYFDQFYLKACQVRRKIYCDFQEAFKNCDALLAPVATHTAFRLGEKISDPMAMYYNDVYTTAASLSGLPAMSLPIGLDQQNLPIGLQIMSPPFQEDKMLELALKIEELASFKEKPNVW
ncbi:MAG: Asp-tRNA(Asn)/Glu-tRNA(Gln) amidotransferase subunit GatA [Bdellovibrionales bacterium]|nr:Asp-tRNA(Asn)/Glu-tRNA(Gln) amidotransferase subunit GatA [Bdellovibrionales bacterium]